jgi:hypothetical protein
VFLASLAGPSHFFYLQLAVLVGTAAAGSSVPPHVPYAAWSDPIKAGQCRAQLRLPVLDPYVPTPPQLSLYSEEIHSWMEYHAVWRRH